MTKVSDRLHGLFRATVWTTLIIAGLGFAAPARADQADDLVAQLHYDQYYSNISKLAVTEAVVQLKAKGMAGQALDDVSVKLGNDVSQYEKTFLGQIADSYRSRFTPAELSQLIAFYQSLLGLKVSAAQPSIRSDLNKFTSDMGVFVGAAAAQHAK